jgi:hypothetical protein
MYAMGGVKTPPNLDEASFALHHWRTRSSNLVESPLAGALKGDGVHSYGLAGAPTCCFIAAN